MPEVHIPPFLSYRCIQCGQCCRRFMVELDAKEHARLSSVNWGKHSERLVGKDLFLRSGRRAGADIYQLAHDKDGSCLFLEDGLCLIHKRLGFDAKLYPCRLYPFTFAVTQSGVYTGVRFDCAGVTAGTSDLLLSQQKTITSLGTEYPEATHQHSYGEVIALAPGNLLPSRQIDSLIQALIGCVVRQDLPFYKRLLVVRSVANQLLERKRDFDDAEFEELCGLLCENFASEPGEDEVQDAPGRLDRLQLRRFVSSLVYVPRVDFREMPLSARLSHRLGLFRKRIGMAFSPGRLAAPDWEYWDGDDPTCADWLELRRAYFASKLFGRSFFGPLCFDYPFLHGLHALLMVYPATVWLAERLADSEARDLRAADLIRALRWIDVSYGQSPALDLPTERMQARLFDATGALARLLSWAGIRDLDEGRENT